MAPDGHNGERGVGGFFFPVKRTTENSDGTTFRLVCVCFFFPHFLAEAKNDMKLNYIVIFTSVLQVGELV